ncbi:MAG: nucleoside deaminase [Actinobacteria bacterium]|nr:nucleoside deaminase [Actinomycetota bacterium]
MPDLDEMWPRADAALLRCLELAHQSFLAGGLPVGSVIVAASGERISEGRNRAYDPAGGAGRLQRTPIAHAEMNALADVDTGTDLGGVTLWSSHQPCLMCAAACEFTGVGAVMFIAPDPSADRPGEDPDGIATEWVIAANLLFLSGVAAYRGPVIPDDHASCPARAGNHQLDADRRGPRSPAAGTPRCPCASLARYTGRSQGTARPVRTQRVGVTTRATPATYTRVSDREAAAGGGRAGGAAAVVAGLAGGAASGATAGRGGWGGTRPLPGPGPAATHERRRRRRVPR